MTNIAVEDLRGDSPPICGHFNKIKEEVIRAAGEDQNEVERLLTEKILMEFVEFHMKKRKQYLEKKPLEKKKKKRMALRITGPKKPLKNQEEEGKSRKLKKQIKKPLEKKKRMVLTVIPPKKPLESASNNSGNINQNQEKQEEEEEGKSSRKPKRQRKNPTEMTQAPCMPTEFKDKIMGMQGSDIKLVIQKDLTITDMEGSQDRLSIPRGQMRYDFLSREEQVRLEKKEANGIHFKGLEVPLIEPSLEESSIFLKKWKLGSSSSYMLSKPWINIAERNKLKSTNTIQLWSFRVNQKPHLALVKLEN